MSPMRVEIGGGAELATDIEIGARHLQAAAELSPD